FAEQATDVDPKRREATLHRIQRLVHDKAIYAPIWQLAFLNGVGPRVEHSGLGVIPGVAYSGPYEDVRLKRCPAARADAARDHGPGPRGCEDPAPPAGRRR